MKEEERTEKGKEEAYQEMVRLAELRLKEHLNTAMILDKKAGLLIAAGVALIGFLLSLDVCDYDNGWEFLIFATRAIFVLFLSYAIYKAFRVVYVAALYMPGVSSETSEKFLHKGLSLLQVYEKTLAEYLKTSKKTQETCEEKARLTKTSMRIMSVVAGLTTLLVLALQLILQCK